MDTYPAKYTDSRGSEMTYISNDSQVLRMSLRGVDFAATDFDSFEPQKDATTEQLGRFSFTQGWLCSCCIECQIPIPVRDRGRQVDGVLSVELVLGNPAPNGSFDREDIRLVLTYGDKTFAGPGTTGWFEDELLGIQAQLPDGVFMKSCINCLYSDYFPGGHGLFGGMMCFRNLKSEYIKVTTKQEFWPFVGRQDRIVQETYLCPEFERRIPGTGYRG